MWHKLGHSTIVEWPSLLQFTIVNCSKLYPAPTPFSFWALTANARLQTYLLRVAFSIRVYHFDSCSFTLLDSSTCTDIKPTCQRSVVVHCLADWSWNMIFIEPDGWELPSSSIKAGLTPTRAREFRKRRKMNKWRQKCERGKNEVERRGGTSLGSGSGSQ